MSAHKYADAKIIRAVHDKDYFVMHRLTAQDKNLSFEARGMIAYLLSQSDTWEIRVHDLQQKCKKGRVYRILDELAEAGYLEQRTKYQDEKGQWQWTPYVLHERPIQSGDDSKIVPYPQKPDTDKPETVLPNTENAEIKESTKEENTKQTTTPKPPIENDKGFSKVLSRLQVVVEKKRVMTTTELDTFKADFDDYSVELWLEAIDICETNMSTDDIKNPYKYIMGTLRGKTKLVEKKLSIATQAKQRADIEHDKTVAAYMAELERVEKLKQERKENPLEESA